MNKLTSLAKAKKRDETVEEPRRFEPYCQNGRIYI
jgi:hypothetical protein